MKIEYPLGATPLDSDELTGLRLPYVSTREQLDHLEQANITSGLIWLSRKNGKEVLSEDFVRKLHKALFGDVWGWAGIFRCSEKNIGIDPQQIVIQLHNLLEDAKFWYANKTYAPIEAAVRFHHRLVFIHPFANGNGRHARIMADALLTKVYKVKPIDWSGGYKLQAMNKRREQYITALRAADQGNFSMLLAFAGACNEKA